MRQAGAAAAASSKQPKKDKLSDPMMPQQSDMEQTFLSTCGDTYNSQVDMKMNSIYCFTCLINTLL